MLCNNCGKEIDDQAVLCPHCDTSIKKINPGERDGPVGGMGVLCFLIPVLGFILYLVWKSQKPVKSKGAGKAAIWGFIVPIVVIGGILLVPAIQMSTTQTMNSNRQAIISDLQNWGTEVKQYYHTPASMGGAGQSITNGTEADLYGYLGWSSNSKTTETGTFTLDITGTNVVEIVGVGIETGNDGKSGVSATLTGNYTDRNPLGIIVNN